MNLKNEYKPLLLIIGLFLLCYYLPVGTPRVDQAVLEAFHLVKWYAREHVLLCLIPAFFIAGAISIFVSQDSVLKYLGPLAPKTIAYGVASVSGTILAVCSCTILPLFAGIYRMGAGLGPAVAFLYSGPAINILAIILTARVLGMDIGIARAIGAISFSIVIGFLMHLIYLKEEIKKVTKAQLANQDIKTPRPLYQTAIYFGLMVAILVFANWNKSSGDTNFWNLLYSSKWLITSSAAALFALVLILWFNLTWIKVALASLATLIMALAFPDTPLIPFATGAIALSVITATEGERETGRWFSATWEFAKQILPLLFLGVLISGVLLGRPGKEGLIPSEWIKNLVGGNSIQANFFSAVVGAFMYFATLTEVPILQGLIGSGMGKGPALALLLAGPAVSLPNMLVLRGIWGTQKTVVYALLVIVMATISGIIFGIISS